MAEIFGASVSKPYIVDVNGNWGRNLLPMKTYHNSKHRYSTLSKILGFIYHH